METLLAILFLGALFSLFLGFADAAKDLGLWLGPGIDNTSPEFRRFFKQKSIRRWSLLTLAVSLVGLILVRPF